MKIDAYALRLTSDYVPFSLSNMYFSNNNKKNIYLDTDIFESFENAVNHGIKNIKEDKLNKILAECLAENHYAINFIRMWNSENIRKEWSEFCGFPHYGNKGLYLNSKKEFAKIDNRTQFFPSYESWKKTLKYEAYNWGNLEDYVSIDKFSIEKSQFYYKPSGNWSQINYLR